MPDWYIRAVTLLWIMLVPAVGLVLCALLSKATRIGERPSTRARTIESAARDYGIRASSLSP